MFKGKKIIGTTGPSIFSPEIQEMVEDYFGAIPLYIHQNFRDKETTDLDYVLNQIDGLVLAGGSDWCPLTRDEELTSGENFSKFDQPRDFRENYLIKECLQRDIPILGICRGHQGLGLYHDMFLYNDISGSQVVHSPKSAGIEINDIGCHYLHILPAFQKELQFDKYFCSSFHHQALFYHESVKYLEDNKVEVLGYAFLNYKKEKIQSQKIIELMRGVENRWISAQNHLEIEYKRNTEARLILDQFKEMLNEEV